jgi:hypothetical protein
LPKVSRITDGLAEALEELLKAADRG